MGRRHQSIRTEAVFEDDMFTYDVGDHVVTVDGFAGVITEHWQELYGAEAYTIVLDDGLGGGEYAWRDILGYVDGEQKVARRYSDVPLVCDKCGRTAVTSTSGGLDGHTMLCPACHDEQKTTREQRRQSARADLPLAERGTVATAEDDYPELDGILWDRPDHVESQAAGIGQVSLAKVASKTAGGRFYDSYVGDGTFHCHAYPGRDGAPGAFEGAMFLPVGTREEAQVVADTFPRGAGVKASTLSTRNAHGNVTYGTVSFYVQLSSSGVNKGVNETGIKKIRTLLAALDRLGYQLHFDGTAFSNSYPSLDAFWEAVETSKTATNIKDLLKDKKTPWLFRHVTGPAADRANEALPPGYKMDDITQVLGDNNWCRFRRDSNCFFPKELDVRATELAGYDVWIPELRGHCARHRFSDQQDCPISEPGPKSGASNWRPDATRSWEQGGQRVSVRIAANKTYCSNCDEMVRYNRDAAGLWDCSQCGSAIECSECGDPMSARHEHNSFGDAALTESQEEFRQRMRDKWLSKKIAAWTDVRDKGKRIRTDGGVRIIANTGTTVTAEVRGDNGIYISSITRVPGTKQRGMWYCGCKWTQYVWARSEPYKRFEGRPCSHSMALWFEMQGREMFGGTITDDPETPSWRTSEPQASWAEGLEFESAIDDVSAKMAIDNISDSLRVAQSAESSSSLTAAIQSLDGIRSMASTSEEFKAKVRGRVTDVQVVDGVPMSEGQPVSSSDVIYPTYDPVAGLFFMGAKTAAEIVVTAPGMADEGGSSVITFPDEHIDTVTDLVDGMSLAISNGNALGVGVLEDLLEDAGVSPVDGHDDMSDFMADVSVLADGVFPLRVRANITREAAEHTGVMVALSPSRDMSARLSKLATDAGLDPEPPEEIHLTLAYCGKTTEVDKDRFMGAVRAFAAQHTPFGGKIQGLGTFLNDGEGVLWAEADIAGLAAARTSLCEALLVAGTPAKTDHDFTPHITLAYSDSPITELPDYTSVVGAQMTFSTIVAAYGGEWSHFDLLGSSGEVMAVEQMGKAAELATVVRGIVDLSGQIGDRLMAAYAAVDDGEGMRTVMDECDNGDYTHAGVIIKALDSGRVLMTQRTPHHKDEDGTFGKWEFPGGGIEPGEDPVEGALREFTEETGLMLPDGWHVEGCQPSGNYIGIVITVPYEAWTTDAELLDRETMGIGWFDPDVDNTEESIVREELQETDWEMVVEARNFSDSLRGSVDSLPYKPVTATTDMPDAHEASSAVKHDEPEPALPEAYGEDEMPEVPFVPGDPRLSHLKPGAGESSEDIAGAAAAFLAKNALKDFSSAEQNALIEEGSEDHVGASNTDRLDLTGTFYEQGAEDDELVFY